MGVDLFDEGIRLHGAERVLNGEIPYRDFYALYGPAQFYWPALLFKVFGFQVVLLRVSAILFTALLVMVVFLLCRQSGVSVSGSLLASVVALLPRNRSAVDLTYLDPAIALILLAGVILATHPSRNKRVAVGVLLGTATLFRHDFGIYGIIAVTFSSFFEVSTIAGRFRQRCQRAATGLAWIFLGIGSTAGVVYGTLSVLDFPALWNNLLTFPVAATYYRMLPFPFAAMRAELSGIHWVLSPYEIQAALTTLLRCFVYIFPFVTAGVVLWRFPSMLRLRSWKPPQTSFTTAFLASFIPGLALYGLGRSDWPHLLPLFSASLPFVVVILRSSRSFSGDRRSTGNLKKVLLAITSLAALWIFVARVNDYVTARPLHLERARGIVLTPVESDWFIPAVVDLEKESGPIFVASDRHDRISINAVSIYFLSGRPSGTYFSQLDPGVATTLAAQQRIVADLQRNNVSTVLVWGYSLDEPNLSSKSSGVLFLDSYLQEAYYDAIRGQDYRILKRRP